MGVIKKTVILHDAIERFVRQTQAILIQVEPPIEATYSTALNFMLLAAIHEAARPGGLSAETRGILWDFARDAATVDELNLHERMDAVRAAWLGHEPHGPAPAAPRPRRSRTVKRAQPPVGAPTLPSPTDA